MPDKVLICVDGIDAAGKSTISGLLLSRCRAMGFNAEALPEFSETPLGAMLQDIVNRERFISFAPLGERRLSEGLAVLADWAAKLEGACHLTATHVIAERGLTSVIGYQAERLLSAYGDDVAQNFADHASGLLRGYGDSRTSIRIFNVMLKLDESALRQRVVARGEEPLSAEAVRFLLNVQERMLQLASDVTIDTTITDGSASVDAILATLRAS